MSRSYAYKSGVVFKNRVLAISFLITSIFSLALFFMIYTTQKNNFTKTKNDFENFLHISIDQTIHDSIDNYRILADTVLESTQAKKLMIEGKRDVLYDHLLSKWKLWSTINPDLKIMLFHKADGTAFLRMHKPEKFDDYLSDIRPMVKAVHKEKKVLTGYETGKYSTVFRVITPIFQKGVYIGSLDFGINPNHFVKKIHALTGHNGLLFVNNKYLKLFKRESAFTFKNYTLQTHLNTDLLKMLKKIPKHYNLEHNLEWNHNKNKYILHAENMKDFKGNIQAKLLFFYNITELINGQNSFITKLIYMMLIFWVSMFFLMNKSLNTLLKNLKESHEQHTLAIQEKDDLMIAQSRQAAMGEMISMIAHQWRQPLTVIGMHANNMTMDYQLNEYSQERTIEHINGINRQVEYLSKTINDFRDFFKPTKTKSTITLKSVIKDAVTIVEHNLRNNKIELLYNFNSKSELLTHPNELLQVILIMLSNARDAIKEASISDANITISSYDEDGFAVISICDNGKGINKEDQKSIFNPYFSTKEKNGTGLGLFMSKTIINKHLHGEVSFENKERGVCFYIKLPVD